MLQSVSGKFHDLTSEMGVVNQQAYWLTTLLASDPNAFIFEIVKIQHLVRSHNAKVQLETVQRDFSD